MATVQIKRAYAPKGKTDGYRILVDRLWPRGIKKQNLALHAWMKDLAPSTELRLKFGHEVSHWRSFVSAYKKELRSATSRQLIADLVKIATHRNMTLIYGARDEEHNNAVVLKSVLEKELKKLKT